MPKNPSPPAPEATPPPPPPPPPTPPPPVLEKTAADLEVERQLAAEKEKAAAEKKRAEGLARLGKIREAALDKVRRTRDAAAKLQAQVNGILAAATELEYAVSTAAYTGGTDPDRAIEQLTRAGQRFEQAVK